MIDGMRRRHPWQKARRDLFIDHLFQAISRSIDRSWLFGLIKFSFRSGTKLDVWTWSLARSQRKAFLSSFDRKAKSILSRLFWMFTVQQQQQQQAKKKIYVLSTEAEEKKRKRRFVFCLSISIEWRSSVLGVFLLIKFFSITRTDGFLLLTLGRRVRMFFSLLFASNVLKWRSEEHFSSSSSHSFCPSFAIKFHTIDMARDCFRPSESTAMYRPMTDMISQLSSIRRRLLLLLPDPRGFSTKENRKL